MAIDLLNKVQENMGFPPLKKIDPNTEETVVEKSSPSVDRLSQIVVPTVLAGFYKLAKSEQGIQQISSETTVGNWVEILFADNKDQVINKITEYTYYDAAAVEDKMNEVATETVKEIRKNTENDPKLDNMKSFIAGQRNNILPYLYPALHIGNFVDDGTIDDPTNKMEGPISSLMHALQTGFSGHETEEDASRKEDI